MPSSTTPPLKLSGSMRRFAERLIAAGWSLPDVTRAVAYANRYGMWRFSTDLPVFGVPSCNEVECITPEHQTLIDA